MENEFRYGDIDFYTYLINGRIFDQHKKVYGDLKISRKAAHHSKSFSLIEKCIENKHRNRRCRFRLRDNPNTIGSIQARNSCLVDFFRRWTRRFERCLKGFCRATDKHIVAQISYYFFRTFLDPSYSIFCFDIFIFYLDLFFALIFFRVLFQFFSHFFIFFLSFFGFISIFFIFSSFFDSSSQFFLLFAWNFVVFCFVSLNFKEGQLLQCRLVFDGSLRLAKDIHAYRMSACKCSQWWAHPIFS